MGVQSSPRVFTKLLKPIYAHLRSKGDISNTCIDDSCLQSDTKEHCIQNIIDTVRLFESLGLTINMEKRLLSPRQWINLLGFILCYTKMTVRLQPAVYTMLRIWANLDRIDTVTQMQNIYKKYDYNLFTIYLKECDTYDTYITIDIRHIRQ